LTQITLVLAESLWDREFQSQETALSAQTPTHAEPLITPNAATAEASSSQEPGTRQIDEELARTAGQLVETVKDEVNPKFKESAFMGLMRQLRDGEVVVEGDRMVEAGPEVRGSARDVKGKGRVGGGQMFVPRDGVQRVGVQQQGHEEKDQVDPNDAYFRAENEEFIRYWNDHHDTQNLTRADTWDYLQEQWDRFEATSIGIRPVDTYQFQLSNPYLLGNSSARDGVQRQRNAHEVRCLSL
jgi:peroxin-5